MLFSSFVFLFGFLPAAIIVYRLADPYPKARIPVLIALSLVFYGYWDWRFLLLMFASIGVNWYAARLFAATRHGSIITAAIVLNLFVLGVFKYSGFFAQNIDALTGYEPPYWNYALPLGISFFTFHHVMYLVDLRRGRAPLYSLGRYALYICFFPQAIAGPLARWNEVVDQFGQRVFAPGWERRCAIGVVFMIVGLAQKILLADPLARLLDPIYAQAAIGEVQGGQAWLGLGFAFQVFFDFAGYSDIAIGVALIFGVQLPRNFDAPFRVTSILEFWQRWHMTLARFLRDYVFSQIAKAGSGGRRARLIRTFAALFLTMALCGLWHGAGWTFVIWGGLHGIYLIVNHAWQGLRGMLGLTRSSRLGHAAARGLTFVAVVVAWVFFRAQSFSAASTMLSSMFLGNGLTLPASLARRLGAVHPLASLVQLKSGPLFPNELVDGHLALRWIGLIGLVAWFAPNTQELLARYRPALGFPARGANGERYRWLEWRPSYAWSVVVGLIAAVAIMNLWIGDHAEFIYFQF
jgi:hypothetical protein